MTLQITGLCAALLALWMIGLSAMVSIRRGKTGIGLLYGDDARLVVLARRHGNLTETAPMALILMGIAESQGAAPGYLYATGGILLAARLLHPFGISTEKVNLPLRPIGSGGTFVAMLMSAGFILWKVLMD